MKRQIIPKKIAVATMTAALTFSNVFVPYSTAYVKALAAEAAEQAATENIYESTKTKTFQKLDIVTEDWSNDDMIMKYDESISGKSTTENFTMTAEVSIDEAGYQSLGEKDDAAAEEDDHIKLQGVVKLGADWTWTDSQTIPYLKQSDFTKEGDVYKTKITIPFSDKEAGELKGVYIRVVAQGFHGDLSVSNVVLTPVVKEATTEKTIYTGDKSYQNDVDFTKLTDDNCWDEGNKVLVNYDTLTGVTVGTDMVARGKITIDKELYDSLDKEGSYLKLQSVVKLGDKWDWTQGGYFPILQKNSFTEEDGKYVANFEDRFSDMNGGEIHDVILVIVGVGAKGSVTVSDMTLSELVKEEETLPEKEPTTVADFESDIVGTKAGWDNEDGWQYPNDVAISVDKINGSNALKLGLDYTGCGGYTWSEAKVKKTFDEGIDVSAYNILSYDLIYPEELDGAFKTKVFAKNAKTNTEIINKEGTAETTDLGNGMKKATIKVKFSPNKEKITDLTIGTVGVSTEFKGDVYIDNLTLSQYNAAADFVDITETPNAGAQASIDKMKTEVSLSDTKASSATKALYSYLMGLDAADQVLFGHQNDTHKHVTSRADVYSDSKDVTGSISGLVGIDSLALTGKEIGETDTETALEKCIEIGKKAAQEGGILTLSTHMPNMSNKKIKETGDAKRPYDFSECDFQESKDLSNNCAQEVLPGGKYNKQFTAYLDIIADYAKGLGDDIPVLFRPFHENDGGWFWWGSASTDKETYKSMYRYMEDYLTNTKGVHNLIYVYSPNGPVTSETKYLDRYPGDDYVDILAFDYYDDYNTYPATYSEDFIKNLKTSCEVIKKIADEKGKVAAISETGVRVMKQDGSDNEGILVKNNPIKDQEWYSKVNEVAKETGMPYFLLWANFSDTNFYIPYKYNDTKGQELINEFIDFYNEDSSIFANGTNFYGKDGAINKKVTNTHEEEAKGYFTNVFSKSVVKADKVLKANVENAKTVQFVLKNGNVTKTIDATASASGEYEAKVSAEVLDALGKTDIGMIDLVADGNVLSSVTFVSFGQEKQTLPENTIDNFELYYGDDDYLNGTFTENSAANCSSNFTLDNVNKSHGSFGGAFNYTLKNTTSEVWTGRKMSLPKSDYSKYNALSLWVKPDGKGQKLVIQLVSNGEDFEVFLNDFVKTNEAKYITIPFDQMKGKNGGKLDPSNITNFAVWCNSVDKNTDLTSTIVFDDIQFGKVDASKLTTQNGYAVTDEAQIEKNKTGVSFEKSILEKTVGDADFTNELKIASKTENRTVTYSSSDDTIASVDAKTGKVHVKKAGKVFIRAEVADTENDTAAAATYLLSVSEKSNNNQTISTPTQNTTSLAQVTGVKTTTTSNSVKLSWKKTEGADGYRVYRYDTKKKQYVLVKTVKTTSYTDTKKKAASTYRYKVEAVVTKDGKIVVGKDSKVVKATTKLTSVKNVKAKLAKNAIKVNWKKNTTAAGYEVFISTGKKESFKKAVTVKKAKNTTCTISSVKAGNKKVVKVRAYKLVDGKKIYSTFSSSKVSK